MPRVAIAAIATAILLRTAHQAAWLPTVLALPLALALLVGGAARAWPALPGTARRAAAVLIALSAAALFAPAVLHGAPPLTAIQASRGAGLAYAWAVALWIPMARPSALRDGPPTWLTEPSARTIGVIGVCVVLAFVVWHRAMVGSFAVLQDEVSYVLQARWLREPRFGWPVDPELLPFLRPEFTAYRHHALYTQYPPGWPAVIALFSAVGLQWLSTVTLAACAVGFTYAVGRRAHSATAGMIAAVLLAAHVWTLDGVAGYMSHVATMAFGLAGAYCLLRGEASERRRAAWWITSGFLLASTISMRPLTGVALVISLVLWLLLRGRVGAHGILSLGAFLAAGAALPIAALLYYNTVTNGHPLLFGYSVVHGSLHSLGFGLRGQRLFGGTFTPTIAAEPFTPRTALANLADRVWDSTDAALPLALAVPLLWYGFASGYRYRRATIAAFVVLPAAYFFYFTTSIRFYSEILPYALIAFGSVLAAVCAADWRGAGRTWLAVLAVASLAGAIFELGGRRARTRDLVLPSARVVADAHKRLGPIVVFVREPSAEGYLFRRLSYYNLDGLRGPIIVARDHGAANATLMRRLRTHSALRGVWNGPGTVITLSPIARVGGPR
ncbi:MAG: hypothetical protein WKG32_00565 [Gemmatimonadaceae bacterium]